MNADPDMTSSDEAVVTETSSSGMGKLAQLGIGFLVLVLGLGAAGAMIAMSGSEEQVAPPPVVTPVEAVTTVIADNPLQLHTTGTVIPAQQVNIIPQVGGALRYVSEKLQPGGVFSAGEVLARVDSREYRYAVEQQRSSVEQAEVELTLEEGRQQTALREWELLGGEGNPPDIVARRPQLQVVEASLLGAQSRLATAQLSLERTALKAPFNAVVVSESAEVGQVVGGASIATLVGTDEMWVQVSVPVEMLSAIDIPGISAESGSPVTVSQVLGTQAFGNERIVRSGSVSSLSGQLDSQSRTATLIVTIDDPFNLQAEGMPGLPMLPGAFVEVEIHGRAIGPTISIPRVALQNNDHVWVAEDGALARRAVTVSWGEPESVYISTGLKSGEQVITTPLSFPIEGMPVLVRGEP